jgi:hypothetical protein
MICFLLLEPSPSVCMFSDKAFYLLARMLEIIQEIFAIAMHFMTSLPK